MTRFASASASLRRLAVTGLVASTLIGSALSANAAPCYFGECDGSRTPAPVAASPSSSSSSSDIRVLSRHGTWTAMTDGSSTLIMNRFDDGAKFAILDKNNELALVWTYDGWHYQEGESFSIKIDVDGDVYKGTIVATSATTLIAKNVTKDVIRALYNGRKAKIAFASDTFTITSLPDAAAAIDDAIRFQKTSSR